MKYCNTLVMYGELRRVMNEQGGRKEFPLIQQSYYAKYSNMLITPDLPFVVKVGGAHAGSAPPAPSRSDFL